MRVLTAAVQAGLCGAVGYVLVVLYAEWRRRRVTPTSSRYARIILQGGPRHGQRS